MRVTLRALLLAALSGPAIAQPAPADTVLRHGVILTVDAHDRTAQALAIRAGRIVAVGDDRAIGRLIGPKTRVMDLAGRTATPGLIDAHAHAMAGGLTRLYDVDLGRTASMADLLAKVRARAATLAPGEWVRGSGWNEGILAEHRAPTLAELDAAAGDHPVALINVTGHYLAANSAALALAHIDRTTRDPPAGTIDRDAQGAPTGLLREAALDRLEAVVPPPTLAQRKAALHAMIDLMHSEGMTGFKDPDLVPEEWAAYVDAARGEGISAHACALIHAGADMASAQKALDLVLRARAATAALPAHDLGICGVKIYMDGSAMARTAWMSRDYPADAAHPAPTGRGYPTVEPDTYRRMVKLFTKAGVPVGTHVIGDKGIDVVADAYAEALAETPRFGLRHSLIHAHIPSPHALDVMAELQRRYDAGIPEEQAEFLWWLGDALPSAFLPDQADEVMPLATYKARGIIFAGGSDFPVTPLPARYGLWASVAREPLAPTPGAHPFGLKEAIDVHTALRSYTAWAARQIFAEKETGALEPGKWADIAVWDRNPYAVPTAQLKDMQCQMTFYKGRQVFQRVRNPRPSTSSG